MILWEKIREQGEEGKHGLGLWPSRAVGHWGTSFQRKPVSDGGGCAGAWECRPAKARHLINLLPLGILGDGEGRRRRFLVVITQPLQSVLCVLIGWFSISAQDDF